MRDLIALRADGLLARTVVLDAYVWFAAALQVLVINRLGLTQFGMDESNVAYLLVPELAGVALGGLLVGRLANSERWHRVLAPAALAMGAVMAVVAAVPLLPAAWGLRPQIVACCGSLPQRARPAAFYWCRWRPSFRPVRPPTEKAPSSRRRISRPSWASQ